MINNYTLIGFEPGNSLQSSELNELQERFYINQTLDNNFLFNWMIFTDDYFDVTGGLSLDKYGYLRAMIDRENQQYSFIFPVNPNLVYVEDLNTFITITIKKGWYKLFTLETDNLTQWIYLDQDQTIQFLKDNISSSDSIILNIEKEELKPSELKDDEGYQFNSNVAGFIEPFIRGSSRIKLSIKSAEHVNNLLIANRSPVIMKIRKGIDGLESNQILIQYLNNYKIIGINTI